MPDSEFVVETHPESKTMRFERSGTVGPGEDVSISLGSFSKTKTVPAGKRFEYRIEISGSLVDA